MTEGPLVSVIIPSHNRAVLLPRAVESVLAQTYSNLEVIIVDDASSDSTPAVMADLVKRDPRVRYFRHETNRYASAARNTGIASARGELIAFLDDDDEWLPEKLAKQVPVMLSASPEVGMVYCWMDYYDGRGNIVSETHPTLKGWVFGQMLDRPRIGGCPTLLVRREVVEVVGGFDEDLPRGNDGDFMRRVALQYAVDLVPEVLVRVNVDHGHQRISDHTENGVRNALKSQEVKLVKFKDELRRYPKQKAIIYANIAHHHGQLGQWRIAFHWFARAVVGAPTALEIYRLLLHGLRRNLFKRRNLA